MFAAVTACIVIGKLQCLYALHSLLLKYILTRKPKNTDVTVGTLMSEQGMCVNRV